MTTLLRTIDTRIVRHARIVNTIVLAAAVVGLLLMVVSGARLSPSALKEFLPY